MAQFDLLDQLLRQNASPAGPQVDLMAQLAQGLPAQKPGYQVPQVPLVLAPPTPRPVAAPQRKRAVVPSSNLPAGVQTQLPAQTLGDISGDRPSPAPLSLDEQLLQLQQAIQEESDRQFQGRQSLPMSPDENLFSSLFPPKTVIGPDQFKELASRTTPGIESQKEDIAKLQEAFDQMYGQGSRTPSSAEVIGKALMDFGTGSGNIVDLINKRDQVPAERIKALALVSKAKNDLSENEIKLLNSQFQQMGLADRLDAMSAATRAKTAGQFATEANKQALTGDVAAQKAFEDARKARIKSLTDQYKALLDLKKQREKPVKPSAQNMKPAPQDASFGKFYTDTVATGEYASAQKDFQTLEDTIKELKSGRDDLSGPAIGRLRRVTGYDPLRSKVETALVSAAKKSALDGQFAAKEMQEALKREYNPDIQEKELADWLEKKLQSLKQKYEQQGRAIKYWEQNNSTLRGFQGLPSMGQAYGGSKTSKPKTVIQNGHTYRLNEATGKYE